MQLKMSHKEDIWNPEFNTRVVIYVWYFFLTGVIAMRQLEQVGLSQLEDHRKTKSNNRNKQ